MGAYRALAANQPFTPFTRVGRCVTHEHLCKSPAAAAQVNNISTTIATTVATAIINVFLNFFFTIFISSNACCVTKRRKHDTVDCVPAVKVLEGGGVVGEVSGAVA